MNKDLTVGKPEKVLWAFCLPLFGSIIFQQLYNIADSLVAGKFIGENALAAVGNSYEITLIFIAFAFGCNIGCSVVVSRYFGAKLYADMKTAVHTTLIFSGAVCAVLMTLGLIFQQPLAAGRFNLVVGCLNGGIVILDGRGQVPGEDLGGVVKQRRRGAVLRVRPGLVQHLPPDQRQRVRQHSHLVAVLLNVF